MLNPPLRNSLAMLAYWRSSLKKKKSDLTCLTSFFPNKRQLRSLCEPYMAKIVDGVIIPSKNVTKSNAIQFNQIQQFNQQMNPQQMNMQQINGQQINQMNQMNPQMMQQGTKQGRAKP